MVTLFNLEFAFILYEWIHCFKVKGAGVDQSNQGVGYELSICLFKYFDNKKIIITFYKAVRQFLLLFLSLQKH